MDITCVPQSHLFFEPGSFPEPQADPFRLNWLANRSMDVPVPASPVLGDRCRPPHLASYMMVRTENSHHASMNFAN